MPQQLTLDVKADIRDYWQARSATYDRFPVSRTETQEKEAVKKAFSGFLHGEGLNILDVGTGTGFLALLLAELGHRLTAVDLTDGMMAQAEQKARRSALDIRFEIGDAENLPFEDRTFDAVVCRYCLWTFPEPQRALREWQRVVRPGGLIAALEGQWQDASLKGRLKRLCRSMGILLYERANPRRLGYRETTKRMLPFPYGISPQIASGIFMNLGLTDVRVETLYDVRRIHMEGMPLLYRLAMSPPTFLIAGTRRGSGD